MLFFGNSEMTFVTILQCLVFREHTALTSARGVDSVASALL